jgi:hypothetical protein
MYEVSIVFFRSTSWTLSKILSSITCLLFSRVSLSYSKPDWVSRFYALHQLKNLTGFRVLTLHTSSKSDWVSRSYAPHQLKNLTIFSLGWHF